MRIMSFNVLCGGSGRRKWQKRVKRVVKTILNANPDTLGVQEAHHRWMRSLRRALPGYAYVGAGRDNGKKKGEYSAIFYKKDKFTADASGTFWLSETPDTPSFGWDAACIRICTWVKLTEKATGKKFVHFNTHLDHKGAVAMQKGAELVVRRANEICTDCPAFFTGDFNVTPESAPCLTVKNGGFSDSRDIAEKTDMGYTFHDFENDECDKCIIDYVFVKGSVRVKEFSVIRDKIDGDIPSDHYPVCADVEF